MVITLESNYAISIIRDRSKGVRGKFVSLYKKEDNTPIEFSAEQLEYYCGDKMLQDEAVDSTFPFENPCILRTSEDVFNYIVEAKKIAKRLTK